jgi:serine-type D-Ala-D-Ala carboxypeptidase
VLSLLFTAATISVGDGLPAKAPAEVGMSAERLASIDRVVGRGISAGGYPGAAVVVGRKGAAVWEKGFGRLDWTAGSRRVSASESIYDLASLTKVVGTTTAIMILLDEGKIALDAPVRTYIPEFTGGGREAITVRQLLAHRSGLPASRNLWRVARSPAEARQMALESTLVCKPNNCTIYSDIGAITLGILVERVSGLGLDSFLAQRVFQPLGMNNTFFNPPDSLRRLIAPTEVAPPRGYPLRGQVHDENAFALGGVAGHAGMFSTASDLSIFAQMMLNGGEFNGVRIVADSTIKLFARRTAGNRALGWAVGDGTWGSGNHFGANTFGHTGYTGTSMWIDPEREMFVILLTNRVHAARVRRPAKVIADVRADLSDAAALAVVDAGPLLAMPRTFRADVADGWNRPEPRPAARRPAPRRAGAR